MYLEVPRVRLLDAINTALSRSPVVALLGPRQCGKTTLAKLIMGPDATFFDLESSVDRAALSAAPELTLKALRGLVVIDEIQTVPALFPLLRVLADRSPPPARFLILGSSSPDLIAGVSESLAGRVAFVYLTGFDLTEVGVSAALSLWQRGGFPRSFLSLDDQTSYAWRQDFIETFLSRDAVRLGIQMAPEKIRRFWTMLAHVHGGHLNAAELGRGMSLDQRTASHYVDLLVGAFLLRRLPPWFENAGKRIVKAPKIYVRDSGLLHALLGLRDGREILSHPRFGISWESFALEQILTVLNIHQDAYFWGTHAGAELDLLVIRGGRKYGFEFKYSDAPRATRSMRVATNDLGLAHLFIVYPGARRFPIDTHLSVLPLEAVSTLAAEI